MYGPRDKYMPSFSSMDVHIIPEYKGVPKHKHYDLRYLLEADMNETLIVSSESKTLAWLSLTEVEKFNAAESIMRMVSQVRSIKTMRAICKRTPPSPWLELY